MEKVGSGSITNLMYFKLFHSFYHVHSFIGSSHLMQIVGWLSKFSWSVFLYLASSMLALMGYKPLRPSWKTGKIWKICHFFHSWWLSQLGNVAGSIFLLLREPHFISTINFRILGWDYHCEKQINFSILIKKSTYYGLELGWGFFNSLVDQFFPSDFKAS